jgi:protein SEY1
MTPLSNLEMILKADLARIWENISKPKGLSRCRLSDYFDLAFTSLPNKVQAPGEFAEQLENLSKRFVDDEHKGYVLKPIYHKRVRPSCMERIWVGTSLELSLQQ